MNKCIVCESGGIIVGEETDRDEDVISLSNASVVRSWSNGKDEYTLDPIGDVNIRTSKVLFEIPCEW